MKASARDLFAGTAWRLALGIGALYALLGTAWILFSDAWVLSISADPDWLNLAQRTKGLFYVAITATALTLLVLAGYRQLRRSGERQQAQFRQLHQSLAEVLWLASADGREMLYLSPAFESLYGRPADEFLRNATLWLDAVHPEDRERAQAANDQLFTIGHCACDYRICRPDGSVRWVQDRKKAIVDEHGQVTMIGGIAEDITTLKERDAARALTQAQLEQMVADRTEALERVNAELDAFSRTVAHDLKSPLGAIVGYAELLHRRHGEQCGAAGARMMAQIGQSAWHMTALINDLLVLSGVAHAELRPADVDLARLSQEIVDDLCRQEPERVLVFEAPPTLVVRCDAGLARSLMANVLGNAWKFSGKCERVWIRLSAIESVEGTTVRIEDHGAGFDPARATKLFKPFQRLHSADEFSGTGIGLATCARIIERHAGRIWIESTPGRGTTLGFLLPAPQTLHEAAAAEPATIGP